MPFGDQGFRKRKVDMREEKRREDQSRFTTYPCHSDTYGNWDILSKNIGVSFRGAVFIAVLALLYSVH